ncbi:helix-turn-helix domain-containing protein [Enterococcus sp. DIV1420a]|uniref:helix-turn-helix domain-containing protein n=1 Tax=Enterococcus sp. DIV1420a TaxID=2774672 RepID=UPI003F1FA9D4
MLICFTELLIEKIAQRCKKLRLDRGFKMEAISDKAAISRIEKGIVPKSGNYMTATVLFDYVHIFDKSPAEIIFGTAAELENVLCELFYELFFTIMMKDLTSHAYLYHTSYQTAIEAQTAVLSLAEMFAEYNFQRYHFLQLEDKFMDDFCKKNDVYYRENGKLINPERDRRSAPINEATVIDFTDMASKMWWMCQDKMITSFQAEVMDTLFDDFNFSTINTTVNQWINQQFNKVIVPNVIKKLRSNTIFKLGLIVQNMIKEFLDENLTDSFQTTVPVKTTYNDSFYISSNNFHKFTDHPLSDAEVEEKMKLIDLANEMALADKIPDQALAKKFDKYGITYKKVDGKAYMNEVDIDALINQALTSRRNGITRNDKYKFKHSSEFYDTLFYHNKIIPGYLTNNSQIMQRLQEHLNKNIIESINIFIHLQNNLLQFLSPEELLLFAK